MNLTSEAANVFNDSPLPTIHVISDSVGATAQAIAKAAAGQFGVPEPYIETLPKARDYDQITNFLLNHQKRHVEAGVDARLVVFYTLVDKEARRRLAEFLDAHDMRGVDLMGSPLDTLSEASGLLPSTHPGLHRQTDESYFRRIDAMEFTVEHDDGRNPQDLLKADIVILGVSRSSKTPISIYLGLQGYKVANVPLALDSPCPPEVFECDPTRVYGLVTTPDVLVGIRQRRLGGSGRLAQQVASSYAEPEMVYRDLEEARSLMRKIGCLVVHTDNRAIEETAQEILRYYELAHPSQKSIVE